jgi:hypothetical protein
MFTGFIWLRVRLCGLVVRVSGYRSRGPGFDFRPYQIFWEVRGLERGPLSLVRTIEELFEWKNSGSGLETEINGRGNSLRWPRNTLYPQRLAPTSPTSGGRSVGIVRLRTTATEFFYLAQGRGQWRPFMNTVLNHRVNWADEERAFSRRILLLYVSKIKGQRMVLRNFIKITVRVKASYDISQLHSLLLLKLLSQRSSLTYSTNQFWQLINSSHVQQAVLTEQTRVLLNTAII